MFFKRKQPEQSLAKIFTFFNSKVHPEMPRYQKAVFKKMGFSINQVMSEKFDHGEFLNSICRRVTDTDYLIFFDIDCIPTRREWFVRLMEDLSHPRTIVGAAQTANHLREAKNLYVSPFFMGISTAYLRELVYPDMRIMHDLDTGQCLTEEIVRRNGRIVYWWPTEIEEEKWTLYHSEHNKFGPGTTYGNMVYHAFLSRENQSDRFFDKCKAVLSSLEQHQV